MVRSCYATKARFYDGDATQEDIEWYFVPSNTPFIPVPSVINSLIWADDQKTDTGHAGEVPGARRPYRKGARDVSLGAHRYCGTALDWLGLGVRPHVPIPVNVFGNPSCCESTTDGLVCDVILRCDSFDYVLLTSFTGIAFVERASNLAYSMLLAMESGETNFPWSVDLYYANPNGSGTNDYLTDFTICDFPGYATQYFYETIITPPGTGELVEQLQQSYTWTSTGLNPDPFTHAAIGCVCADALGQVLWFMVFEDAAVYYSAGDFLTLNISYNSAYDYP